MTNKDLLKEAIAEAKTIREAAIANAKEALEETLTPHLKEMLAQKLQEMEDLEETDNNGTDSQVDGEPTDIDHGNVVNEEDEEEEAPEEAEDETPEEETEEEGEDLEIEDMSVEDLKDLIRDIVAQETGVEGPAEEIPGEEGLEDMEDDNTIDIDELLAELEGMDKEVTEDWGAGSSAGSAKGDTGLDTKLADQIKAIAAKTGKSFEEISNFLYGGKSTGIHAEAVEDLNEALATVKTLRGQLQEVNLLNAKLLYVNKVFKSNNLSEGQKVNVIAAFDKAETVREVKLVFETVSKNVVTKKPTSIKEHTSFASKATGNAKTTAPKEIISEVSDQVKRMQFLAGIIK